MVEISMDLQVKLLVGAATHVLVEGDLSVIPSRSAVVVVDGLLTSRVRLDGRNRLVRRMGGSSVFPVDLKRSTGFHHLHIEPGHDFWFGTEDSKLRLDGIIEMLNYLRGQALGWSGQLLFSDGSYIRDAHVTYGWLDLNADELLAAAEAVARRPIKRLHTDTRVTQQGGSSISLRQTLALLRRRGSELLYSSESGPLTIMGTRYSPVKVVARRRNATIDSLANRRVAQMTATMARLVTEVEARLEGGPERQRCREWRARLDRLILHSSLSSLFPLVHRKPLSGARSTEETVDSRYTVAYEGYLKLSDLTGWVATRERRDAYAFVEYSDQIYQAFVAHAVAKSLGARATAPVLGLKQPAFSSDEVDIYYDTTPPAQVMRTWRSFSARPDEMRPDFVFHFPADGSVVLADAKYRSDGARASESSRRDLMLYMQAYGLRQSIIFYPPALPALATHTAAAQDNSLTEVTVTPAADLAHFLEQSMPALLRDIRAQPAWSS